MSTFHNYRDKKCEVLPKGNFKNVKCEGFWKRDEKSILIWISKPFKSSECYWLHLDENNFRSRQELEKELKLLQKGCFCNLSLIIYQQNISDTINHIVIDLDVLNESEKSEMAEFVDNILSSICDKANDFSYFFNCDNQLNYTRLS
jgi:hypothetical protein